MNHYADIPGVDEILGSINRVLFQSRNPDAKDINKSSDFIELIDDGKCLSIKGGDVANETVRKADEEIREDGVGNSQDGSKEEGA